jgi:two-component system cell cycle sensor histidine kinase/response regulator CckA
MFPFEDARGILGKVDNPLTLLEGLFVHSPIGVQLYDPNGHTLFVNRAFFELFGSVPPPEYCVLRDELALQNGVDSIIREAFSGKVTKIPLTWYDPRELQHVKLTQGRRVAIETFLVPICSESGKVKYVVFFFRDVTAEHQLEQANSDMLKKLKEANALVESLMNGTEAVIYAKDLEGRFLFVNNQYGRVVSMEPAQIIGKLQREVHPPDVAAAMRASDLTALDGRSHYEVEETVIHPDGSTHDYLSLKFPLADGEGKIYGVCGISTDITKVRRLEQELGQARRMESLGLLAGGVAHDFNNLLGMILLHTESLNQQLRGAPGELGRDLAQIRSSVERASALVRQLMAFGRRLPMTPVPTDLNVVVRDLSYMIAKLSGEGAELELAPAASPCMALADPSRLEQVLLNLCMNARDAISAQGRIRVTTGVEKIAKGDPGLRLAAVPGSYVYLEVEDNGHGMDQSVLERAFDPFFTTKEPGSGSGLGLSTVFGIMQESRGNLRVRTSAGNGCSIRLYFPQSTEAVADVRQARQEGERAARVSMVLVEDEPLLRQITARQLRFEGFTVFEAANGAEARAHLRTQPEIKMIVSDVIMPGQSGPALVKELNAEGLLEGIGVLFVSGYSRNELAGQGFTSSAMHLVEKPFTTADLIEKIAKILKDLPPSP